MVEKEDEVVQPTEEEEVEAMYSPASFVEEGITLLDATKYGRADLNEMAAKINEIISSLK